MVRVFASMVQYTILLKYSMILQNQLPLNISQKFSYQDSKGCHILYVVMKRFRHKAFKMYIVYMVYGFVDEIFTIESS